MRVRLFHKEHKLPFYSCVEHKKTKQMLIFFARNVKRGVLKLRYTYNGQFCSKLENVFGHLIFKNKAFIIKCIFPQLSINYVTR